MHMNMLSLLGASSAVHRERKPFLPELPPKGTNFTRKFWITGISSADIIRFPVLKSRIRF